MSTSSTASSLSGKCEQPLQRAQQHPCTTCNNMIYCSTNCQEADRPTHSEFCSSFRAHRQPPPPDQNRHQYRAIYFPMNAAHMRFVWVEYFSSKDTTSFRPVKGDLVNQVGGYRGSLVDRLSAFQCPHCQSAVVVFAAAARKTGRWRNFSIRKLRIVSNDEVWKGGIVAVGHEFGNEFVPRHLDSQCVNRVIAFLKSKMEKEAE
jgi:predicted RNA-binding Zn-ribbon protein involved in translation (DUF1610 family)